jgi:hypothetical protein
MTQSFLNGLNMVLTRAQRASAYAFDWAVRRNDFDGEIIATAALLHDFAEMLDLVRRARTRAAGSGRSSADPGLRSSAAQRAVLNVEIDQLEHELLVRWHLPELLRIVDEKAGADPKVRNVNLAVALARHSANGWDNPALPDDYSALPSLLNIPLTQARLLVAEGSTRASWRPAGRVCAPRGARSRASTPRSPARPPAW